MRLRNDELPDKTAYWPLPTAREASGWATLTVDKVDQHSIEVDASCGFLVLPGATLAASLVAETR